MKAITITTIATIALGLHAFGQSAQNTQDACTQYSRDLRSSQRYIVTGIPGVNPSAACLMSSVQNYVNFQTGNAEQVDHSCPQNVPADSGSSSSDSGDNGND